jgi:prepilin-type N-terminal cleavage/methylation domain-containing protein
MKSEKQAGFSLIELLIVLLVINLLAAIAITFYVGMQDKSRRSVIIRTASSSTIEVSLWLQSSISTKRTNRDVDTNFDGIINAVDKTNQVLQDDGVAKIYAQGRNSLGETSPWSSGSMWNFEDLSIPNGRISLIQTSPSHIRIVGKDKSGNILYENIITVD